MGFPYDKKHSDLYHFDIIKNIVDYHKMGMLYYYLNNNKMLFSGDSLFYLSIGRNDFKTSDPKRTRESLRKIFTLNDDVKVYPGHGISTSIGYERSKNPFVNR